MRNSPSWLTCFTWVCVLCQMSYGANQTKQLPKKGGAPARTVARPPPRGATSAFSLDDDDDGDDELATKEGFNAMLRKQNERTRKQVEQTQKAALNEDPSIYDYDGVYDQMQEQRDQQAQQALKMAQEEKKSSKYIENLKRAAELKKMEQDRYYERRLAKERKEEDELYKDKDKYITSAYRKKMEEQKKWETLDKLMEEEEKKNDVTKKGMDAFFSNLMTSNIAMGGDVKKSAKSAYTVGSKAQEKMLGGGGPKSEEQSGGGASRVDEGGKEEEVRQKREEVLGESSRMQDPRQAKGREAEEGDGAARAGSKRPRSEEEKGEGGAAVEKKPAMEQPKAAAEEVKDPETVERERQEAIRKARERFLARKKAAKEAKAAGDGSKG